MGHASYFREVFNPEDFEEAVYRTSALINKLYPDVDYIVGSGISGITVASAIAFHTKKHLFIVRKEIDDTHSRIYSDNAIFGGRPRTTEYEDLPSKRIKTAVIIDDLISSGNTVKRIADAVMKENIKILALILYHDTGYIGKAFDAAPLNFPMYSIDESID